MCSDHNFANIPTKKSPSYSKMSASSSGMAKQVPSKKKAWKKPKDMPKRPLSAYNLFFADERREIMRARGGCGSMDQILSSETLPSSLQDSASGKKLGFAGLARTVAAKWKALDPATKSRYEQHAAVEQARYRAQIKEYNDHRMKAQQQQQEGSVASGCTAPQWPAMPQTIANLGSIYDSASTDDAKLAPLPGDHIGNEPDTAGCREELAMPKGELKSSRSSFVQGIGGISDSVIIPRRKGDFSIQCFRRSGSATGMVNWNEDRGLARRLSDPQALTLLAAELDQDQVDFLQSLKEED
jgi:hypothetical protein